jgi:transposase
LAVNERSFQKRHESVTVLTERNSGTIIEILDDRKKATLKKWLEENQDRLQAVRSVSMDMLKPLINAVQETIEGAEEKICFDRFNVVAYFGRGFRFSCGQAKTSGRVHGCQHEFLRNATYARSRV